MTARRWLEVSLAWLIVVIAASPGATQARTTVVPALSVSSLHDDNLFSREDAVGDYLTQLRPSLDTTYESPVLRLDGNVWFDMQHSARYSSLSTFDARRHASLETRYRATPAATLGLVGRYDKTETPGELNVESGILLDRQRAQRWEVGPSFQHRPDARTTIATQYTWTHETLRREFDEDLHVARFGVIRQRTPRTSWSASYLGRVFTGIAALPTHSSHAPLVGVTHQLTPATRASVFAGPRFTSYRGMSAEVSAALSRTTPRTRFLVDYWHGETIVLGIPGPVSIASATSRVTWTVKRNLEVGTHLGVFQNTALDLARTQVYHASVVAAWNPSESYIVGISYGTDFQRGDIRSHLLNESHARRGVFLIRLTVAPRFGRGVEPPDDPTRFSPPVKGIVR